MKALLLKDFYNLKQYGAALVVVVLFMGVAFGFDFNSSVFAIMSCTVLGSLSITLIHLDESSNWSMMQKVMPVTTWQIVISKYITALLLMGVALSIFTVWFVLLSVINGTFYWSSLVMEGLAGVGVSMLLNSILIPLTLKFGAEKARMLILLIIFVPTIILFFGAGAIGALFVSVKFSTYLIGLGAFFVLMIVGSMLLSKYLIENKEF